MVNSLLVLGLKHRTISSTGLKEFYGTFLLDLRVSRQWVIRVQPSGMWHHVG